MVKLDIGFHQQREEKDPFQTINTKNDNKQSTDSFPLMDLRHIFGYGDNGANLPYRYSYNNTPAISQRTFGPMKFDLGSSPNSPLYTHFSSGTFSTMSNSQEQYSSTENHSGISPSPNSLLEIDSSFNCINDSIQIQDSPQIHYDANCDQALQEIESALMNSDTDMDETINATATLDGTELSETLSWKSHVIQPQPFGADKYRKLNRGIHTEKRYQMRETPLPEITRYGLKQLLIDCARALSENRTDDFQNLIQKTRSAVSITGEPIQRLGAYMVEGLVARKEASGTNIYHSLRFREPESKDLLSYTQTMYDICPYFKFGFMAANGAIAEAFRNEDRVHIIDFQISQGTQWVTLIQALAARSSGPPHVRVTGIVDLVSEYAIGDGFEVVRKNFVAMSEKFNIPIEFHVVPVVASEVTREMLDVRPEEALAVNFTLHLHHTPDESVCLNNPRDGLLRMVRSLSPKVTTLVEQESNTNTTPFLKRFIETLNFYSAMFESIDDTLPRDSKERINVEQQCLVRDIVNIIACEKEERVERHELLGKWKVRMTMAGFRTYPLSSYVNQVIRKILMRYYSEHYTLMEKDGAMLLGWKDRELISVSAWH